MRKRWIIFSLLLYITGLLMSFHVYSDHQKTVTAEDYGQLLPTKVKQITAAHSTQELQEWIKKANEPIAIAGMQHSQGGQTLYPNGTVLDMKEYNKILDFQPDKKKITVQSGVTWADIQEKINPYGLSLKVMQSQNIFTVGGSLSVNVHGRDIRYGSLIDNVDSFRLLKADGEVINISRTENSEWFPYVIGGYGLFGIILDVTLQLADDELYQHRSVELDYTDYDGYFTEKVAKDDSVRMHIARLSVAPDSFLKEMYVTDYVLAEDQSKLRSFKELKDEKIVALPKFMLGLSRYSDWGKDLLWDTQVNYFTDQNGKYETRNNVMRSDSEFMDYENPNRTEVLQEYFVPIDDFKTYVDDLRHVLEKEELNLLNITIRYVEHDENAVLSYAKDDMFALVLLINQGRSKEDIEKTEKIVRKMIDVTLAHEGSYYLPYYSYPSNGQLEKAYPRIQEFFHKKKEFDPEGRFKNLFYERYSR